MRIFNRLSLGVICFALILLSTSCGIISGGVNRAASGPGATMLSREDTPLAPTAVPQSRPGEGVTGQLAGTISGLDPGDSAKLALEFLEPGSLEVLRSEWLAPLSPPPGKTPGPGEVRERFEVVDGGWGAANLSLEPGLYRLVPQAPGYVHTPRSILFAVPEAGVAWRYLDMDFEFLHPGDAPARLGAPICPERPAGGGVYVLPEGTPTPTPAPLPPGASPLPPSSPEKWPPGTCYAGYFYDRKITPAGLRGQVGGLPAGQVATVSLYALTPEPGENYAMNEPPPPDGTWHYPPEVTPLADPPAISPDWPLTATLTLRNGVWGLVDPSLAGGKYLVVAQANGLVAEPPAYQVVIFTGKVPGLPAGVDFTFATTTPSPTPSIGISPEDWLRQLHAKGPPELAGSLRILGRREWKKGVLLFISYQDVGSGEMFGYSLLERVPEGEGWTTAGGQLHGSSETRPAPEFVDWGMGAGGGMKTALGVPVEMRQDPVVVYGRALTLDVQAVAVTFASGRGLRDEAADGMFAIVLEPTARACELLVLGEADQVLRRINLTEERRGSPGIAEPDDCAGR
jgi:hypothetical protein